MQVTKNTYRTLFLQNVEAAVETSRNVLNGRCCVCGDSKENTSRRRLYLLLSETPFVVYCHNCGYSAKASTFFKEYFPLQWRNALNLSNGIYGMRVVHGPEPDDNPEAVGESISEFLKTKCFPMMPAPAAISHSVLWKRAAQFVLRRKIPKTVVQTLYVCYTGLYAGRVIFPFFDVNGKPYYFQGRDVFGKSDLRYLSWSTAGIDGPIIYRWNMIDKTKLVFVTEGLIDCLYLPNAIATCGVHKTQAMFDLIANETADFVYIPDNDRDGRLKTRDLLVAGVKCFIWPKELKKLNVKDIGDAVEWGIMDSPIASDMIIRHTASGVIGLAKLLA